MSLPSFINKSTSLDDGVANQLAGKLFKLRDAERLMNSQIAGIDDILSTIDGESLPDLPNINDIRVKNQEIAAAVGEKVGDLAKINDLAGGCLSAALGAAVNISKDSYGFISDLVDDMATVANMPSQMFDIYKIYVELQEFIASLGIDKLVSDINSLLGCESATSFVADVNNEVNRIMSALGTDSSGLPDGTTYYEKMKADLSGRAPTYGIDTTFTDSMAESLGEMASATNNMAKTVSTEAKTQMDIIKTNVKISIPKSPTPPSFF